MRILDRVRMRPVATATLLAAALLTVPAAAHAAPAAAPSRSVCAATSPGIMHCDALVRTDIAPKHGLQPHVAPSGYAPSSLQSAYNLTTAAAGHGSGVTVAIVDAYNDPNANADLGVYRAQFGLPACTVASGCLRVVGQTGSPTALPANAPPTNDWALEESLDLNMVSAICPNCSILLVEANSPTGADLGTAVNEAVALGAKYVSNSYGGSESAGDPTTDSSYYNHPGVVITASTGDSGYGTEFPATSPHVTAVGGTTLTTSASPRGWAETAWSGAGSGCSSVESKPAWQTDSGCARRSVADVSAVADPSTGPAVYDTFNGRGGWLVVGGTSASAPIIASVYALAGLPVAGTYPSQYPYRHTGSLYDVTAGSNGSCGTYLCTAVSGYDGPTGLGTPNGATAFAGGTGPTVAFQSSGGSLWLHSPAGDTNLGQSMAAGTSPAVTTLPTGGYEEVFQSNLGHLVEVGTAANLDTGLSMAPGTSPSIAAQVDGTFKVSFQGSNGHLEKHALSTGLVDTGLLMMAGTSPSITPIATGNYETAYQSSTGTLAETGVINLDTGLTMAAGTNPSIAGQTDGTYKIAYQASNGHLSKYSAQTGASDNGFQMMPGTSPSITPIRTGNYETAFQDSTGALEVYGNIVSNYGYGMMTGTSPSITTTASSTDGYTIAFQANTGHLWVFSPAGGGADIGLPMRSGTSPAIAP